MATQITTRTLCDFCQADEVETPDAERIIVTIDDERWEIDVCKVHGKPLRELADTLAEHGRRVPMRATTSASADGTGPRVDCPECHKSFKNRSSLGSHGRAAHGKTLRNLEGRSTGKTFTCKDCGRVFDTVQGIAVHRARLHPSEARA